jgi:ABC-type multidrug transport system permease subunit
MCEMGGILRQGNDCAGNYIIEISAVTHSYGAMAIMVIKMITRFNIFFNILSNYFENK